jgi:hypothetical protein
MATSHGRLTVLTVATKDISAWTTTSNIQEKADIHDKTGYGAVAKAKDGGLVDNTFSCSGTYDKTLATSPRGVFRGKAGTTVVVVRKPEGTVTGAPVETFNAVIETYNESNAVDDLVRWSADLQIDGVVTVTTSP